MSSGSPCKKIQEPRISFVPPGRHALHRGSTYKVNRAAVRLLGDRGERLAGIIARRLQAPTRVNLDVRRIVPCAISHGGKGKATCPNTRLAS